MKKSKIFYVLGAFTIIMLGLFGYVLYTRLSSSSDKYIKETKLEEISLEDDSVLKAFNSISFKYRHDLTSLEKKLFSGEKHTINDLKNDEKMLLLINDIGFKHKLPTVCSGEKLVITSKSLKDSIINLDFLNKYNNEGDFEIGPFTVRYNNNTLTIANNYCSNPLEYSKIVPIKALKSNKRLVLQVKYLYIEEVSIDNQMKSIAYNNMNKQELIDENYTSSSELENFNTYEVTFNYKDKKLNFYSISLLK